MTSQHHEITSFFVDASKALEELPHVKSKLNQTEEELAICRDINHGKDGRINDLLAKQSDLELAVERLKREKDDAELAAMEAKDQAERLIASIRDVMKGAAAADAILNPTPQPLPSSTPSEAGLSSDPQSGSSSAPPVSDSGSQLAWPFVHSLGEQHSAGGEQRPLADAEPAGSSLTNADSSVRESFHATEPVPASPKPYDGEAYWFKPSATSWKDWVAGGGERAPYVTDADLEAGGIY